MTPKISPPPFLLLILVFVKIYIGILSRFVERNKFPERTARGRRKALAFRSEGGLGLVGPKPTAINRYRKPRFGGRAFHDEEKISGVVFRITGCRHLLCLLLCHSCLWHSLLQYNFLMRDGYRYCRFH